MSIRFSNMTIEEDYRRNGSVSRDTFERMLDRSASLDTLSGIDGHIEDAKANYPSEDFLVGPINRLQELSKKLRGDNKTWLLGIIEALEDIAQTTFYATDYGRSELNEALKVYKQAFACEYG